MITICLLAHLDAEDKPGYRACNPNLPNHSYWQPVPEEQETLPTFMQIELCKECNRKALEDA